jgi:hypothetical protein
MNNEHQNCDQMQQALSDANLENAMLRYLVAKSVCDIEQGNSQQAADQLRLYLAEEPPIQFPTQIAAANDDHFEEPPQ